MGRIDEEVVYRFQPETGALDRALDKTAAKLDKQAGAVRRVKDEFGNYRNAAGRLVDAQGRYIKSTDNATRATDRFRRRSRRTYRNISQDLRRGLLDDLERRLPNSLAIAGKRAGLFSTAASGGFSVAGAAAAGLTLAIGVTLIGAIVAAGAAIMEFHRQFTRAMDEELERVGRVQLAMQALDISRQEAKAYNQQLELSIARSGASLPVAVRDIQAFYGAAGDEIAGLMGEQGAAIGAIQKQTVDTSSQLAILQAVSGVDTGNALANIQAFLGGAGAGELRQMTLFQRNPRLQRQLQEGIRAGENRVELMIRALNDYITPEMIADLQGTSKAKISGFMDKLFDPTIGVFSITRDLEPDVPGYQSVATEFGKTIDIFFGENGLFENLAETLGLAETDPMVALRKGIENMNAFLISLNELFDSIGQLRDRNSAVDRTLNATGAAITGGGSFGFQNLIPGVGLYNTVRGINRALTAEPRFTGDISKYGQLPIMEAIALELRNKPSNADLVIANSRERILTEQQYQDLLRGRGRQQRGPVTIQIIQQPGQSAQELAYEVKRLLDEDYASEKDSWL